MSRSMQEILDHADELAAQFERLEPADGTDVDVPRYVLRRAVIERARSERHVIEAVRAARRTGMSWGRIGRELGVSGRTARERYGELLTS